MLKSIAQPPPDLQASIYSLNLPLNQAQKKHTLRWLMRWCRTQVWHIICRLWRVESVDRYLVVPWLALEYLEVRRASHYAFRNLTDVIRLHRQEHARALLEEACRLVLQTRDLRQVFDSYTLAVA